MQHTVFRQAGMTTLTLSSSRPEQRNREETWYDFGDEGEHFRIEPMQAHGGWVCTAADLTRFLDKFWINGNPRLEGRGSWVFYGSLPGTTSVAVQRPDGLNYVLLMNKRGDGASWNEKLKTLLDAAIR
jgi:CubicO group peptidase (beta-lactamase class C family)